MKYAQCFPFDGRLGTGTDNPWHLVTPSGIFLDAKNPVKSWFVKCYAAMLEE